MQPHVLYLALTSHLKIGITRPNQLPTRWIDQGAIWGVPLLTTTSRYNVGLLEHQVAQQMSDRTQWRDLLKGFIEPVHDRVGLAQEKQKLLSLVAAEKRIPITLLDLKFTDIRYPVTAFLTKAVTINLEKNPVISDILIGIKGQYLFFKESGAVNIRKYTGFDLTIELDS
jgi:hypothetical protein